MDGESFDIARVLVENHRRFLSFVGRRVGSEAEAEEILQSAYVKSIERGASLRDNESAVAWFFRLLRNAIVDHFRRRGAERRALERNREAESGDLAFEAELEQVVCECVQDLVPTLKPDYALLLGRVDLQDWSIAEVAREDGITANNVRVKLHRARNALRRQLERSCGSCATHGCLDCTCDGLSNGSGKGTSELPSS